jgi:hypothetical protein
MSGFLTFTLPWLVIVTVPDPRRSGLGNFVCVKREKSMGRGGEIKGRGL